MDTAPASTARMGPLHPHRSHATRLAPSPADWRRRGRQAHPMKKIRVGVLTGGASAERDISLAAGAQIQRSLPSDRYEVVLLDPLAFMVRNPALTEAQREQARDLLAGGARVDPAHELPKGLESEIV